MLPTGAISFRPVYSRFVDNSGMTMDLIAALRTFLRAADTGSFSAGHIGRLLDKARLNTLGALDSRLSFLEELTG